MDANDIDGDGNSANNPADDTTLGTAGVNWADRSPSGNNLVVAQGDPIYNTDATTAFNGYPVISFDDATTQEYEATTFQEVENFIAYYVYENTDAADTEQYLMRADYHPSSSLQRIIGANEDGDCSALYGITGNCYAYWDGSDNGPGTSTWDPGNVETLEEPTIVSFEKQGTTENMTVNALTTKSGTVRAVDTFDSGQISNDFYISSHFQTVTGNVAEFVVYEAIKNAAEKTKIESA